MFNHVCPLCCQQHVLLFSKDKQRDYLQCQNCLLVFVSRAHLLSPEQERQHYLLHNNDIHDRGYRQFLSRLAIPLLAALTPHHTTGLDFGCGPGPLLAMILAEAGYEMHTWDPFFANFPAVLQQRYDFITCTEAIEHFVTPANEWHLWLQLLKPNGLLAVMTKCYPVAAEFSDWYYKRDPTHVSFFSPQTFQWLANKHQLQVAFPANDVVIFCKAG